jgi:hypothetical protein
MIHFSEVFPDKKIVYPLTMLLHGFYVEISKKIRTLKVSFIKNFLFQTIIASTLGGFIVDAYQFCKNKLKR